MFFLSARFPYIYVNNVFFFKYKKNTFFYEYYGYTYGVYSFAMYFKREVRIDKTVVKITYPC